MDLMLIKDDSFNVSKEQILCFHERHTLEMHSIIRLEDCVVDMLHPTCIMVHYIKCVRI